MRAAVGVGLALVGAASIVVGCGPGVEEPRARGAQGVFEAQEKLFGFMCECEAEIFDEDAGACEEELAEFGLEVDIECIDSILVDHPDDQAVVTCQADALYDYYECFQSLGCEALAIDEWDDQEVGEDGEAPDEVVSDAQQCEIDLELASDACGDVTPAVEEEIEDTCDFGGQQSEPSNPGCAVDEDCD